MLPVSVALLLIIGSLFVIQRKTGWRVLQYAFFLRYPLMMGCALVALPLSVLGSAAPYVKNLFVLEPLSLVLVGWMSVLAAWEVMYTLGLLYLNTSSRVHLPLRRSTREDGARKRRPNILPKCLARPSSRLFWFGALSAPTLVTAAILSPGSTLVNLILGGIGILCAVLLRLLGKALGGPLARLSSKPSVGAAKSRAARMLDPLFGPGPLRLDLEGYQDGGDVDFGHAYAAGFFLLTLLLYGTGLLVLTPFSEWGVLHDKFPTLGYVLILVMLWTWILPALSFLLDRYRLPTAGFVIVYLFAAYSLFDTDHYYEVLKTTESAELTPSDYIRSWTPREPSRQSMMVIVAASGGGITAAHWTATVLKNLHDPAALGRDFGRRVSLVSSTSGGSVGAMYYVDAFGDEGEVDLDRVTTSSGTSSLQALAFGLAYPDFLRLTAPFLVPRRIDRGSALVSRWSEALGPKVPTLADWKRDVRVGRRPATIFNATLSETGERLLITPLDLKPREKGKDGWLAVSFTERYPCADLTVATAAYLSAIYPYVAPISRPLFPDDCSGQAHHVADGGYYDNYGIVSAVEFLRDVLPAYREQGGQRVLLVEIRVADTAEKEPATDGYGVASLGPLQTMLNVRTASQLARNELDVELSSEVGMLRCVAVENVVFELRDKELPISWQLSETDKDRIARHWHDEQVEAALRKARRFWKSQPPECRP